MARVARRQTRQRGAIGHALREADTFLSAQQLHEQLRSRGTNVGLATVYRALRDLSAAGEVDVVRADDGEALYRSCEVAHHHHHIVCRACGRSVEISSDLIEKWAEEQARAHGFENPSHTFELYGTCSACG